MADGSPALHVHDPLRPRILKFCLGVVYVQTAVQGDTHLYQVKDYTHQYITLFIVFDRFSHKKLQVDINIEFCKISYSPWCYILDALILIN